MGRLLQPRRRGRGAAFALIEVVIVIIIMAIFGAMAMPRYAGAIGHYRVDAAAKRIAADIALARGQAMTSSVSQGVAFNASAETYTLANMPSLDNRSANYIVNLAAEPYKVNLVSALFGSGNQATLTFDVYGAPDNGGTIIVTYGSAKKTITVDAVNGKVTIQ